MCVLGERVGLDRVWQAFSVKDQIVNILGFVGHIWSLLHNRLCFSL